MLRVSYRAIACFRVILPRSYLQVAAEKSKEQKEAQISEERKNDFWVVADESSRTRKESCVVEPGFKSIGWRGGGNFPPVCHVPTLLYCQKLC